MSELRALRYTITVNTMMKHYDFDDIGIEVDNHPVSDRVGTVETGFEQVGIETHLEAAMTPKPGSEAAERGLLVTPKWAKHDVFETLDNIGWLTVDAEVAETFTDDDDVTGSQEITHLVARNKLTTVDVIEILGTVPEDDDVSQLEKVIHLIDLAVDEGDPATMAAYTILEKSLGWDAERILAETGDFNKALASLDPQGVDLGRASGSEWSGYDWPDNPDVEGFQLKTMQRVTSQSLHLEDHQVPHLSYAWTREGILVADMAERKSNDKQAAAMAERAGVGGTEMKKSHDGGVMSDQEEPHRVTAY